MNYRFLGLIKEKKAKIGIIGIGYVGYALAEATSRAGFETIGFDIEKERIVLANSANKKNLSATDRIEKLRLCDVICVCVPTPIKKSKKPDLAILKRVSKNIAVNLRRGQLVIVESSVAPGTTRNLVLPALEESGLILGKGFFLAYSPERVDPGNLKFTVKNTPKVVGAQDPKSLSIAVNFYQSFVEKVIPVSSFETAEMTKVLENTFRLVNISLINEIASFCKTAGINTWEVIKAASTKPYGFLAHYPGPGAGGDCIPVLPYYLLESAKKHKVSLKVVKMAAKVNELQPKKVAEKAIEVAGAKLTNGHAPKVLLIGVAYKEDTSDIRHSPALKIWEYLEKSGMAVAYHDPHVSHINGYSSQKLTPKLMSDLDLVIIATAHKKIPFAKLAKNQIPIIDTRNVFAHSRQSHIIKL